MCRRGFGHVERAVYFDYERRRRVWPGHCHAEAAWARRVRQPSGRALARVPHAREPSAFRHVNPFAGLFPDGKGRPIVSDDRGGRSVDCVHILFRCEDAEAGERARYAAAAVRHHLPRRRPVGYGRLTYPEVFVESLDSRHGSAVDEPYGDVVPHLRPRPIPPFTPHPPRLVAGGCAFGLGEYLGRGGRIIGGRRVGAKLTPAESREYRTLLQQFHGDETAWAQSQQHGGRERPLEIRAVDVLGAKGVCDGPGATDGTDYLLEYSDGTTRWGRRPRAMAPGLPAKLRAARAAYLAEGERTVEQYAADVLDDAPGALWLATTAPLAVGARPPRDVITDAGREMGDRTRIFAEFAVREARIAPRTPVAQALGQAATRAYALAEEADRAVTLEKTSPQEQAALAERAETAWAWAAAVDTEATTRATPTKERAEARRTADRAYAEWLTAKAREATGTMAGALAEWAQALPEYSLAAAGNADGAHAAAEADARSPAKRFRPSARPGCFFGSPMPAGDDGKRRTRPSLALTDVQRSAAATLPHAVPVPDARDMHRDPRVAWDGGPWRMWSDAPRRLGWKLTAEQHAHIQRQRLAATARRAAARSARPHQETDTLSGVRADETAAETDETGTRPYGANRARQHLAEALAAEERADTAAARASEGDGWLGDWSAEDLAAAEDEATGAREGEEAVEPWDAIEAMEAYDDAGILADAYLRQDTTHATTQECAGGLTATQRRLMGENHVLALEGRQRREEEQSARTAAELAAAATAADKEWRLRCDEATATRRSADARVMAMENNVPIAWETVYRDANAKAAERTAAERRKSVALDAERADQEASAIRARATAISLTRARAALARIKLELGDQASVTDAERDALAQEERDEAQAHAAAQAAQTAQAAHDNAARAALASAAAAAERLHTAQEAIAESLHALAGGDARTRQSTQQADEAKIEEDRYANVEYWDTLTAEQRVAILASPTLRLCVRHRDMEQAEPRRSTDSRIDISMEPKERRNISTEETKHIAAIGLAIEHAYDIQYAYAVDGSKDEAEAWGDGATGERAAAWGAWDGITAYGGALPPDTGNQEAELYAIERILARHERGDRILLMCDCQAALTTVDGTWQSGRVGTGSPAAGRTGGLLVEAITRHRLRIESRTDDSQPRGCVCFLWVKAHGGGIVPNAYADAIAKSCLTADVDYANVDAPYLALPRACLYATTPTPRDDTWELDGDQYSCIAADKSLRHIIIDGITRHALDRLPKPTQERCDARIVGEVTHMRGRPEGAAPGAPPRRSVTAPTATGGALRLRSNDLRQHVAACPLCLTPGPLEGDHTMRCTALSRALREAAMAKVTAALDAAASALPSGALCAPAENTMQAWKLAARRAGQHGAIAALGPTPDAHHPLKPTSAREWAHRGWKTKADEYALDLGEGAARPDKQLAMWCAIAVCSAHAAAIQAADAVGATAEVASACSAAIQKIEEGPLGTASRAIGHVALNEESGAPDDGGIIYQTHDEGGIDSIRIRFIQLQPHTQGAHLREWSERRSWLPSARAHTGKRTWSAHTHRGFCSEGGAAGRKVEHSVAVDPLDAVYSITAPATWPWRVEYEIHGHDTARPDGTPGQRVQISVRLGYADGAPKARVSARHVRADGRRHRGGDTAIHAEVELAGDMQGLGLRAMFWDVAYGAHAEEHGAQAAVRRATAAAALRCQGGPEGVTWRSLRSVLGGEVPPPTPRERLESHLAKRAVGDAAATEAEARVTAKHDAAPPGPAPTHVSTDAERLGEAAEVLGVQIDAPPQEMRRAQCVPISSISYSS